jgi:hypothetical protein
VRGQEAIDDYAHALDYARSGNDRTRECRFLLGLSFAQFNAHQIEAMLDTSERSGALAEELGEVAIQASGTIASALAKGICDGATPEIIEQAEEAVRLLSRSKVPPAAVSLRFGPRSSGRKCRVVTFRCRKTKPAPSTRADTHEGVYANRFNASEL